MESNFEKARRIMREADDIRRRITEAQRVLDALDPKVGLMLKVGTLEINRELRPAIIQGIQKKIDDWKAEVDQLESKVTVQ